MKIEIIKTIMGIFIMLMMITTASALSGNGSIDNPYIIESCSEFLNTTIMTSSSYKEIVTDIDCSSINPFPGIDSFRGYFDGNGHSISNLYLYNNASSDLGFINGIDGVSVINDVVFDSPILNHSTSRSSFVIGLALSDVNMTNVIVINGTVEHIAGTYGGLIGDAEYFFIIDECAVEFGQSNAFTGTSDGGLVGLGYMGGIINKTRVSFPINTSFSDRTGGFIGWGAGGPFNYTIVDSYVEGIIDCTGEDYCAGMVGYVFGNFTITHSYSNITLSPGSTARYGSIIGGGSTVYGLYVNDTYYNNETGLKACGLTTPCENVSGKYGSDLQKQSTFIGFDFDSVWEIEEDASTPTLQWENPPFICHEGTNISGSGSKGDPYIISSCCEFQMIDELTDFTSGKYYEISNDFNCSDISAYTYPDGHKGFLPIGFPNAEDGNWTQVSPTLMIEGNNHTISDLLMRNGSVYNRYFGIFSLMGNSNISNIVFNDVYIEGVRDTGGFIGNSGNGNRFENIILSNMKVYSSRPTLSNNIGLFAYSIGGSQLNKIAMINVTLKCDSIGTANGFISATSGGTVPRNFTNIYVLNGNDTDCVSSYNYVMGGFSNIGMLNNSYFYGYTDRQDYFNTAGSSTADNNFFLNDSIMAPNTRENIGDDVIVLNKTDFLKKLSFTGFDFVNIWDIEEDVSTPFFRTEFNYSAPMMGNITFPSIDDIVFNDYITFMWDPAYDPDGDFDHYEIRIFNWTDLVYQNDSIIATSHTIDSNLINDGFHTLNIWAVDSTGLNASKHVNFYIDNTDPSILITTPTGLYGMNSITGTVDDINPEYIWISNGTFILDPTVSLPSFRFNWTGDYSFVGNITIYANDTPGNIGSITEYHIFDIIDPICTGIKSKNLEINLSYNWVVNCTDDIGLASLNISCAGGSDFSLYIENLTTPYVFENETGPLSSETTCTFIIMDQANNSKTYVQRFATEEKKVYFEFDLTQLTNVLILATLVFLWLGLMAIGMVFKNFGFLSFGFFIGMFIGLVLSNVHMFLTLVFFFMNISLWYAGGKAMKD